MVLFDYSNYLLGVAAAETHKDAAFSLNHFAEELLLESALFIKIAIEAIALIVVLLAIVKAVKSILFSFNRINGKRMNRQDTLLLVRIDLGTALSLALELLLAADIAATAVAPTWEKLGQLAIISAIRTFLNYFLQREIHELEHMRQSNIRTMDTQLLTD